MRLNALFPQSSRILNCPLCGSPAVCAFGLCADCESRMPKRPQSRAVFGVARVEAALLYGEPAVSLMHRFKYENCRYLAALFARFMVEVDVFPKEAVLVPVPLHKERRKARGFSQTEELCRELSRLTGRRVEALLTRERDTPPQTGLTFSERQANLSGAFSAKSAKGVFAILVDDVVTTGATLAECAGTLQAAGAAKVFALCACSADKGSQ